MTDPEDPRRSVPTRKTLPRSARLLSAADFTRVFSHARRYSDRFFTVLATNSPHSPGRLGLAVSKKALRRAVDRNRTKRQIRETFRQRRHRLSGLDIVVMVRREVATAERAAVRLALSKLLDRVAKDNTGTRS